MEETIKKWTDEFGPPIVAKLESAFASAEFAALSDAEKLMWGHAALSDVANSKPVPELPKGAKPTRK